jgi:4'-phosphopantetheinyl transferase
VHIWAASLEVPASRLAAFQKTLSRGELARAARFHFDHPRNRYIAAHGWLRQLLGLYLSAPAATVEFEEGPKGKPGLGGVFRDRGLQFNLAHSEGLALIAIASATPVGVDVERIRTLVEAEDLVSRFFSKREVAEFGALTEDQKPGAFFRLWTRKEARLKATGEGIAHLLDQVEVSHLPGEPLRRLRLPEGFSPPSDWSLCDLAPGPGFAAALAMPIPGAQPECRRWEHEGMGLLL